jgi:hypothetical protein
MALAITVLINSLLFCPQTPIALLYHGPLSHLFPSSMFSVFLLLYPIKWIRLNSITDYLRLIWYIENGMFSLDTLTIITSAIIWI